jgi:microsomal epoxide hydrolase
VSQPKPFTIAIPDSVLVDLAERLDRTRWPDEVPDSGWRHGTNLSELQSLVEYWRHRYSWRDQERALNRFRQFTAPVSGIGLHFIHEPGVGPKPMPLLVLHGWPTSIVDFQGLLPLLTDPGKHGADPADAFTVIAPSLPGYGFSFRPNQTRFGAIEIADVMAKLMALLGFTRYAVQGGDWGAFIGTRMGHAHGESVLGLHVNLLAIPRTAPSGGLSEDERRYAAQLDHWLKEETGYTWIQGTKPQTLAYGLTDSPVGLAAWMLEKYRGWSDCGGDVIGYFTPDVLLNQIMLYWVTGAINSSFWPYYARLHGPWLLPDGEKLSVPFGYAEFPKENLTAPRSLAEKTYGDIRRWTRMPRGGHFPCLEDPEGLARELREFFRPLR